MIGRNDELTARMEAVKKWFREKYYLRITNMDIFLAGLIHYEKTMPDKQSGECVPVKGEDEE